MENTSPLLFDDSEKKFFIAMGNKAMGPLSAQEVYERIQRGEVGLLHYYWRKGLSDWKRLAEEKEFAVLVPKKPASSSIKTLRSRIGDITKDVELTQTRVNRPYYLYTNNTQYGPFSEDELLRVLKTQKVSRNAYAWTAGWPNWKRLSSIPEFAEFVASTPAPKPTSKASSKSKSKTKSSLKKVPASNDQTMGVRMGTVAGEDLSDKRGGPRRPLVARLFLHNNQDVIIAVCRDISIGGMQVLTDRVPG
ncbi:MAG TPA: DUF4339 domain-containing protein, partial [Oligoflexia bacterium]|nr:DUF4339 domain-containing protein [Oligoflexia bacterium]